MALTALQNRFVSAFTADPTITATDAYITAKGPGRVLKRDVAQNSACQLLRHPKVAEAVARQRARFFIEQHQVRDDILTDLRAIIHSPETTAGEKLRAAELLCRLFGLIN
ncbi:terminase small subunit [Haliea sp. E1-2-M8]|uniref:terminase small subunit n=1 Tax=Haliea sp. E1-2-M8 TaxID=3064706 RepID=UPI00271F1873|nr:terminase small subunit [Haliea sp. E1-2-M8]MDO8861134.1 terminase small subunit [Haliea sp. E1-2-M8]